MEDKKIERKESKEFKKLIRYHRKRLRKLSKRAWPWDYGYIADYFVAMIEFMRDYYALNYNVVACEDDDPELNRLHICKTILAKIDEYFYSTDFNEENILWEEMFNYIRDKLRYLWD